MAAPARPRRRRARRVDRMSAPAKELAQRIAHAVRFLRWAPGTRIREAPTARPRDSRRNLRFVADPEQSHDRRG